ncbi:MAG: dicarboxylate/amino acid:cation symporter [Bacteroidales bacterium]|jgi:Na+/H+-dicarboxylate symporter|nr:dicarboxylate/amino acid:cation symporter [Bacteroidales bacterium]
MKIKIALPVQILIALVLGVLFGIFAHDYVKYVSWAGDMFLRFLKMIVVPIVFCSMVTGVASLGNQGGLGRIAGKTFAFYICTTLVATVIGLVLVNLLQPGVGSSLVSDAAAATQLASADKVSLGQQIINIIPDNIFAALTKGDLLQVIFFAILFGFFVTKVGEKARTVIVDVFQAGFDVIMKITLAVIKLAPYGVFAIVAKMISQQAGDMDKLMDVAQSLGMFLLIVWAGCMIHFFVVLPSTVYFLGKENPWRHMKKMSTAILTAFSTCSSGAALPISLKDSQEKCGISNRIAGFTLPLGATINMNGTALYEGVAVIFIAQVYGVDLSILEQIIIIVTVLFSAIGAASIPMAGLVMLSVAISVAGLPMEGVGLVLAVEQLCDMPRTATNSYGDMCGAVVIAKSEGEKLTI